MSSPLSQSTMNRRASTSVSPQLVTPNGTPPNFPPTFSEAKLAHLLSNFDHGTHSFDRDERETPEERRLSFGDALGTRAAVRRPSFLSSLSISRPGFGFSSAPSSGSSTPIQTPTTAVHTKDHFIPGLSMTKHTSLHDEPEPISRPKSTPASPAQQKLKSIKTSPMEMQRSYTSPQAFGAGVSGQGKYMALPYQAEHRHFDPSKEPRLLGIL